MELTCRACGGCDTPHEPGCLLAPTGCSRCRAYDEPHRDGCLFGGAHEPSEEARERPRHWTDRVDSAGSPSRQERMRAMAQETSAFEKRRYEEQASLLLCPECGCAAGRHVRACPLKPSTGLD
jgi:hypothetical protein